MKAGRVTTGFSKPYIANYSASGTTVTYSNARLLARGVSVNLAPTSSDDNKFYADNVAAESDSGTFTGGEVTLTVDGLFLDSYKMIRGIGEPRADGWTVEGKNSTVPYIGIGYITRWMSGGQTGYTPTILCKTKFNIPEESANTQEDAIDWQTQELTATLMRDDSADEAWKLIGADFSSENEAEAALIAALGGASVTAPTVAAEVADAVLFETLVADMQDGLMVSGGGITGTLKYLSDESNPLVSHWGAGNFMALKFSDFAPGLTSVKVGLDPSESSGLVEIINDPDKNGVFKVTNNVQQNFKVVATDGTKTVTNTYDLAGLTLLSE